MKKPKVFIGSSSEAIDIAKAIELHLTSSCDIYLWTIGFDLSRSVLEDLERKADDFEYAILVLAPDDMIIKRDEKIPVTRDNVIFELGLFVGKLGRLRTFVACDPSVVKLPSDWEGITVAKFDWERAINGKEPKEALKPTSTKILDAIRIAPSKSNKESAKKYSSYEIPGQDELYNIIVGSSATRLGVFILNTDTAWAWTLFPTILEWRRRNVPISIHLTPLKGGEKTRRQEIYRRKLLMNLGVNIDETDELAFRAFILDYEDEDNLDVLVLGEDNTGYQSFALRYKAIEHREAALALLHRVKGTISSEIDDYIPQVEIFDEANVASILKENVSQYKGDGINISFTKVPTSELLIISKYTRSYKYQQLKYLEGIYKQANIEPFRSLKVLLKDGSFSIVTPPVVERRKEGLVVIEGNTRATYFFNQKIDSFPCLLVEGVVDSLPNIPFPISDVLISEQTLAPHERMNGLYYGNFRHIERAIHPY